MLKRKCLVDLLSIFMTLFQHDGSRQFGNCISYNEQFLSFINQSHNSIILEGINYVPQAVNNKINIFGAWEFDIPRIIHSTVIFIFLL